MKLVGKILAFVFVVVFIVATLAAVLAFDTGRVIFDASSVKQIITDIVTKSDLLPAGLHWYASRQAQLRYETSDIQVWQDEPNVLELIGLLSVDDWIAIRREVLSDEILTAWVSATVDGTYTWLDSDERIPDIEWDLTLFKERVASQHGRNSIQIVFDTLDPCTEDQITDFKTRLAAAPAGDEVPYNLCRFPNPWYPDQISDYHEALIDVLKNIPAIFNLTGELARTEDTAGVGPEQIKIQLRIIRTIAQWAPLIPALILLIILALAVRTLRELGNWWGLPLTITAILLILMTIFYRPTLTGIMSFGPLSETPPRIRSEAIEALAFLAQAVFRPMLWQAMVLGLLGVGLIVIGVLGRRPAPKG